MTVDMMFFAAWLSIASTVFTWGAAMIIACRTLGVHPQRTIVIGEEDGPVLAWGALAFASLLMLPIAAGALVYDSVQLHREVTCHDPF